MPQTGFILNEERALKARLQGLTVTDLKNNARPVRVWYYMPDVEITEAQYPFITINLVNISEAVERAHRGKTRLGYDPSGIDLPGPDETAVVDYPIPYDLDFQITTWTRFPQHDRELLGKLLAQDRLPHRFGSILVPEDNTERRLDLLGIQIADTLDGNNKRLFRKVFYSRMSSELVPVVANTRLVNTVVGTLVNTNPHTASEVLADISLVGSDAIEQFSVTDPP